MMLINTFKLSSQLKNSEYNVHMKTAIAIQEKYHAVMQ